MMSGSGDLSRCRSSFWGRRDKKKDKNEVIIAALDPMMPLVLCMIVVDYTVEPEEHASIEKTKLRLGMSKIDICTLFSFITAAFVVIPGPLIYMPLLSSSNDHHGRRYS